jgi:hypothetical protein
MYYDDLPRHSHHLKIGYSNTVGTSANPTSSSSILAQAILVDMNSDTHPLYFYVDGSVNPPSIFHSFLHNLLSFFPFLLFSQCDKIPGGYEMFSGEGGGEGSIPTEPPFLALNIIVCAREGGCAS